MFFKFKRDLNKKKFRLEQSYTKYKCIYKNTSFPQIPCIQLCCPHGQVLYQNPDFDEYDPNSETALCSSSKGTGNKYSPTFLDHNGREVSGWNRNEQYLIVAPKEGQFQCDPRLDPLLKGQSILAEDFFPGLSTSLIVDGTFKGSIVVIVNETEVSITYTWKPDEFCIVERELEEGSIDDFKLFSCVMDPHKSSDDESLTDTCFPDDSSCVSVNNTVHSVFLCISIIFLIITFIVYLIEPSLRKQYLFSRISMAFIVNLTITYIFLLNEKINDSFNHFQRCVLVGYSTQYFFLVIENMAIYVLTSMFQSFFFWINAMAFNIYQKFSNMFVQRRNIGSGQRKDHMKFLRYIFLDIPIVTKEGFYVLLFPADNI